MRSGAGKVHPWIAVLSRCTSSGMLATQGTSLSNNNMLLKAGATRKQLVRLQAAETTSAPESQHNDSKPLKRP